MQMLRKQRFADVSENYKYAKIIQIIYNFKRNKYYRKRLRGADKNEVLEIN